MIAKLYAKKNKKKWMAWVLSVCIGFCVFGFYFGFKVAFFKLNQNKTVFTQALEKKFGFPIKVGDLKLSLSAFALGVSIDNVLIIDSDVPVPFIKIQKIKVFPELWTLLFDKKVVFKKVVLEDLKLTLGINDNITLLGLNGENLPSNITYKTVMSLLSEINHVVLERAEINWQHPKVAFKQKIDGQFDWARSKTIEWQFSGKQQVQIKNEKQWPASHFYLSSSTNLEDIELQIEGDVFTGQCYFSRNVAQKWHIDCLTDIQQLSIAKIREYYVPKKMDPTLLQWLFKALPKGKITEARIGIEGPFEQLKWFSEIKFKSTEFEYAAKWPKITKASGSVSVYPGSVQVTLSKGLITGVPIASAKAIIEPLNGKTAPHVLVEGTVDTTLEQGLLFVQKSPLDDDIAQTLTSLSPEGPMTLKLNLDIPLSAHKTRVEGIISVHEGRIKLPDENRIIDHLTGDFQFGQDFLKTNGVSGRIDKTPLSLEIKTLTDQKSKTIEILAHSTLSASFLQETLKAPFLDILEGESVFTAVIKKPLAAKKDPLEWFVRSDLKGMAVHLPGMLGKTKKDVMPIVLQIQESNSISKTVIFEIEKQLKAKLVFNEQAEERKLVSAYVDFKGPSVQGHLSSTNDQKPIEIYLDYLKIPQIKGSQHKKEGLLNEAFLALLKKPIQFYCADFQYGESRFGEISFELVPARYGYGIKNVVLQNRYSDLSGAGEWHFKDGNTFTRLKGELKSANIGKALSDWAYPTAIRESSGRVVYDLRWPKSPFEFRLGILDGNVDVKLNQGRILGVNPGLGRIMGLLSIENIQRRLQLDFSDLFKKGFVFDTLRGVFQFKEGVANTQELLINGPSAKIRLDGSVNMNNKAIDLAMTVTPHVNVGLPLAAAVAVGNPVVGAGLWFIDKITGSKINKISAHRYHVTGTFETPSITEVLSKSSAKQ